MRAFLALKVSLTALHEAEMHARVPEGFQCGVETQQRLSRDDYHKGVIATQRAICAAHGWPVPPWVETLANDVRARDHSLIDDARAGDVLEPLIDAPSQRVH